MGHPDKELQIEVAAILDIRGVAGSVVALVNGERTKADKSGYDRGYSAGAADAAIHWDEEDHATREDVVLDVEGMAREAHQHADHCGRWEHCPDLICAAIERWVHHETRPVGRPLPATEAEALIHG